MNTRKLIWISTMAVLAMAMLAAPTRAVEAPMGTMTLFDPEDTFINSLDIPTHPLAEYNYGGLYSCGACGGNVVRADIQKRPLLKFDLSGLHSGHVEITEATLRWRTTFRIGTVGSFAFHRLTEPWVEGTGGTTSINGDFQAGSVSWDAREEGAAVDDPTGQVDWATPGGTFDATPFHTANNVTTANQQAFTFNQDGLDVLTDWANNPANNHGFIILVSPDTFETAFYNSERAFSTDDERPRLDVTWIPEPASLSLLAAGLLIGARRRR